jgi:hypothetical protein
MISVALHQGNREGLMNTPEMVELIGKTIFIDRTSCFERYFLKATPRDYTFKNVEYRQ